VGDDGGNSTTETDENTASPINYSDYVRKHGIDTKQGQGAEAVCLMQKDMDNDGTLCLAGASWLARTFLCLISGRGRERGVCARQGRNGTVTLRKPRPTLCPCLRMVVRCGGAVTKIVPPQLGVGTVSKRPRDPSGGLLLHTIYMRVYIIYMRIYIYIYMRVVMLTPLVS
jgi:hypothetical protein